MKLIPVALGVFYEWQGPLLKVWVQTRTDDGIYHGLLEFPGGGIEVAETPVEAVVREIEEEVGLRVHPNDAIFMGTYTTELKERVILLNVFLFQKKSAYSLDQVGEWLTIDEKELSSPYNGKIPGPNHRIIDDLFLSLKK
jgi:8-oxo-dGTP diphosphatase